MKLCSAVLAFLALSLTGCTTIRVHLGTRVRLAKIPVASIELAAQHAAIAPGERNPLIATITETNGKILKTEGLGKGKVLWSELVVDGTVVTAKKGVAHLPQDPRLTEGKTGHLTVLIPTHPGIGAALDLPLHYDYPFVANYSGANGSNGTDGAAGSTGSSGSMGSFDPDNPSAGGNGGDGGNGSSGGNGTDGSNAPPVEVLVALRAEPKPLLQISVSAPGTKQRFYLVDPQGGSLTIYAEGGAGGSGGRGGAGGTGGSGGAGMPSGSNGNSGSAGSDGFGGSNGSAGPISIYYDPAAQPYINAIVPRNSGGPAPTFTARPQALLW